MGNLCIQNADPHDQEKLHEFLRHIVEKVRLEIEAVRISSLHITVRCRSLEILEDLWRDYTSGALNEAAQRYLVTDEVLDLYNLRELKLSTNIDEEEYRRCKAQLIEIEGEQISVTHTYTRTRTNTHLRTHTRIHGKHKGREGEGDSMHKKTLLGVNFKQVETNKL